MVKNGALNMECNLCGGQGWIDKFRYFRNATKYGARTEPFKREKGK
jgi:hypothetical protein